MTPLNSDRNPIKGIMSAPLGHHERPEWAAARGDAQFFFSGLEVLLGRTLINASVRTRALQQPKTGAERP
jgi:hypothetical protein